MMFDLHGSHKAARAGVLMQSCIKIPVRDGVRLNATLYLPPDRSAALPALPTMTPYVGQMWHDFGLYFAAHGYPFLIARHH